MTLTEFLLARLAEDETSARAASPSPWRVDPDDPESVLAVDDIAVVDAFALSGPQTRATADHIARHDPARALAEVAAKRTIAEVHAPRDYRSVGGWVECSVCFLPDQPAGDYQHEAYPCRTLFALASVYADHPDFDPNWAL